MGGQHRRIFTKVTLQIRETWKGPSIAGQTLVVTNLGGGVDGITMTVPGVPTFSTGERVVLFLEKRRSQLRLLGMGQGLRRLRFDQKRGEWMTTPFPEVTRVTKNSNGLLRPAPPLRTLPLETFRSKVMQLQQKARTRARRSKTPRMINLGRPPTPTSTPHPHTHP